MANQDRDYQIEDYHQNIGVDWMVIFLASLFNLYLIASYGLIGLMSNLAN